MQVVFQKDIVYEGGIRTHPWIDSVHNTDWKYYDFKQHPELVSEVLEDFKDWEHYQATQTFYELVRWLNSKESALETDDCAFRGPQPNTSAGVAKALRCDGRLMVFYRTLRRNTDRHTIEQLRNGIGHFLNEIDPGFQWGGVGLSLTETSYLDLPGSQRDQAGHLVVIHFWAWGDDEKETMDNLDRVFRNLFEALRIMSEQIWKAGG
jgi:hypothetical protein